MLRVSYDWDWAIIAVTLWATILAIVGYAAIVTSWPRHPRHRH